MTTTPAGAGFAIAWRAIVAILLLVAVLGGSGYAVYSIRKSALLEAKVDQQQADIGKLNTRAERLEQLRQANNQFASQTRTQAQQGVARNEEARRSDPDVIEIDRPWPAAMRGRVFDNPDPASGSTERAGPAASRKRRGEVPEP